MHQSVNLAIVQFKPRKGEYAANLAHLGDIFAQLDSLDPRPDVAVLPETALTAYFLEGGVREAAMTAGSLARDLQDTYMSSVQSGHKLDVSVGFYEIWNNTFYNSALYVTLGGKEPIVRHVHRKVFLPTYGLFDEERFVDRGFNIRAFDTSWGRAAILVCEDAWHSLSGTLAALDGAQLIIIPSASPGRGVWTRDDGFPGPASLERWERLARDIASEHGVFVALIHLVGNEGGKVFTGGSVIAGPKGDIKVRAPLWDEAIVNITLSESELTRARADMPLLTDLQTMLPHLVGALDPSKQPPATPVEYDPPVAAVKANGKKAAKSSKTSVRKTSDDVQVITAPPSVTSPAPLEIDCEMTTEWLVSFLKQEFERRGFSKAVLGLSGGVDSAVVACLAARALGPRNVIAVRLPYRTSSPQSLEHAQRLFDSLSLESRTVDISAAVDGYLANEPDADNQRKGNVMARVRMIALFDLSARYRALPLGTGNKSERLLGYFTWHADDSPPINPIGDLYKTQVWELARYLGVPAEIVDKPASADLVQGQTDEGDFGISYKKADQILHWLLSGFKPSEIHGFSEAEIDLVRKRLEGTHWKRKLPAVAMVSHSAIGDSYLRPVDY
ncbi:MAG: NAD+ synthase [Gemmatimonadaceae bacterium]|nr:NAD+ synthase [Gemmatimonadaceae bacterium]